MADSDEKLCEPGDIVCESRELRVNVVESKVMGCSRYVNVRLNGKQLEKLHCIGDVWGLQVAADGGCDTDNK